MSDGAELQPTDDLMDSSLAFPPLPSPAYREGPLGTRRQRNRRYMVGAVLIGVCLLLMGAWAVWPSQRNYPDLPHVVVQVHGMT
jgi:hypothetical protein